MVVVVVVVVMVMVVGLDSGRLGQTGRLSQWCLVLCEQCDVTTANNSEQAKHQPKARGLNCPSARRRPSSGRPPLKPHVNAFPGNCYHSIVDTVGKQYPIA
ncbi:hypothetical protein B0T22DRAFT_446880 [Podospora appendiculata]|uniref:Secreted protein n=1 Tax=Podospora appendiculata TaxID=314037 RepID=A0AAE0XF28_9PEZI|nr:hypothetical protein B0T22DRAFT_446880 [Podospora appendiculata]